MAMVALQVGQFGNAVGSATLKLLSEAPQVRVPGQLTGSGSFYTGVSTKSDRVYRETPQLQGYLAHKKMPSHRTLHDTNA